jgi:transposase
MSDKTLPNGSPLTRKKYTLAFKAECVRQMAAGARQTDAVRTYCCYPPCSAAGQRHALTEAVPSSAELDEVRTWP